MSTYDEIIKEEIKEAFKLTHCEGNEWFRYAVSRFVAEWLEQGGEFGGAQFYVDED